MRVEIIKRVDSYVIGGKSYSTYCILITANGLLIDRELKKEEYYCMLNSGVWLRNPNENIAGIQIEMWLYKGG